MNPLRKALATLLETARALPLLAAGLVLAGPAAATADPGVPPVVLTNVVVQKYGEEANWEPLPEGTLFWRTGDPWNPDGLYISDGETNRAVCTGRGDYHSFTNTVKVNGHRIELNDHMSLQAEAYAVLFRCGTNTLLRISAAKTGGFVRYTVQSYSPTGMVIQANVSAGAFVEVTTDLLDDSSWTAATNATLVAETGESTTWSIDFLDADSQFYRVAYDSAVPIDAAITAELPFVANAGIVIPEGQTLRMGSNTWTELPDVGTIATNAADSAVSPVAVRVGTLETNAATHATTAELAAVAGLAATNAGNIYSNSAGLSAVTNALGQRISEFEEAHVGFIGTQSKPTWYAPTHLPTRFLTLHVSISTTSALAGTNLPCTMVFPSDLVPNRETEIKMRFNTAYTTTFKVVINTNTLYSFTINNGGREIRLRWVPNINRWEASTFATGADNLYTTNGVKSNPISSLPASIEAWIAWRNQQPW